MGFPRLDLEKLKRETYSVNEYLDAEYGKEGTLERENFHEKAISSVFEEKLCSGCNVSYPRTEDFFFKKIIKQKNAKGENVEYFSFRHLCKTCHGKKTKERVRAKRYIELKCDESNYKEVVRKQEAEKKLLFKELIGLPRNVQINITRKMKEGYVFTTLEQYYLDCSKNRSMSRRKYDYGDCVNIPKETQSGIEHLTDSYIAMTMGKKVAEVPKEFIETKRLIIKIQREAREKEGLEGDLKFCTCCQKYFPRSLDYFFAKAIRKNCTWKVTDPLRPECKKCCQKKTQETKILKRCKEEGIERKDWEKFKREQLLNRPIFQLKDERLKGIRRPVRAVILRKIREEGYVFTTYEQYKKDCSENNSRKHRKYEYDAKVLTPEVIQKTLPDYYVCASMRKKVSEATQEEIQIKREEMIKKRELKAKQLKNQKQWKKEN